MPNMSLTKVPVPEQDAKVRSRNFEEVCLGYTKEQAMGRPPAASTARISPVWAAAR